MIGQWVRTMLKASRSVTWESVVPQLNAFAARGEETGRADALNQTEMPLPGLSRKTLHLETIMPWPNLTVSAATMTLNDEMSINRKGDGGIFLTLKPAARLSESASGNFSVRTRIILQSAARPKGLRHLDDRLQKSLAGFLRNESV
jgi:hypothetical protein